MLANTHLLFSIEALLCSLKFLLQQQKEAEQNEDMEKFRRRMSSHRSLPACARNSFHCLYSLWGGHSVLRAVGLVASGPGAVCNP